MIDLWRQIDWTDKGDAQGDDVEYHVFLKEAAKQIQNEESDAIRKIKRPEFDEELQNHLIVIGIPVIKPEQQEKFLKLFTEGILAKKKISNGLQSIQLGFEGNVGNQTVYLIYKEAAEAKAAFKKLNNLKFDKSNTLKCFTVKQIHEMQKFKPQYRPPAYINAEEKIAHNWDEEHRNQFAVVEGEDIMLRWLDHLDKSSMPVLDKDYLSSAAGNGKVKKIGFSPKGSYLAVCHEKGTLLYAGKDMRLKGRYVQEQPIDFKFSPDERFLVTYNGSGIKNKENFILFAVEEEIKLKSYRASLGQNLDVFQFSPDGNNLAIAMPNEVYFYTLKEVEQLIAQLKLGEEESDILRANYVQKIAWLLDNKSLMVVCYEVDYNPNSMAVTKVFIYNFAEKRERKWRAWGEHVRKGEIVVSDRGDWVAVIMKKFIKKNHYSTVIQIGNLLKRDDPIEISSVDVREKVGNVSWDFKGNRFAVIHEDESTRHGINVRFVLELFQISAKGKNLNFSKIHETKNILSNRVALASSGSFFMTYNLSEDSPERGKVSFGLLNKDKNSKKIGVEWVKENLMVHQLSFFKIDPSGRFVLMGTEKSYQIWNMVGEIVAKDTLANSIHDLEWRPRFLSRMSDKEEDKMLAEEKALTKKYQEEDLMKMDKLRAIREKLKKEREVAFTAYLNKKREQSSKYQEARKKTLGFDQVLSRTASYEVITDYEEV